MGGTAWYALCIREFPSITTIFFGIILPLPSKPAPPCRHAAAITRCDSRTPRRSVQYNKDGFMFSVQASLPLIVFSVAFLGCFVFSIIRRKALSARLERKVSHAKPIAACPLRTRGLPPHGNPLQPVFGQHGGAVRHPRPLRHRGPLRHRVLPRTAQQNGHDRVSSRMLRLRRGKLLRILFQGTAHTALRHHGAQDGGVGQQRLHVCDRKLRADSLLPAYRDDRIHRDPAQEQAHAAH